jgi:S1-C subfamily serine protease
MKTSLTIAIALLLTVAVHAQVPQGVVRVYIHSDEDQKPDWYGSGALISPTQILTNWHVVKKRRKDDLHNNRAIEIRFQDGSRRYAAVVEQNETWDTALLSIHRTKMEPFTIGQRPKVGETATIHGFGFDYEYKAQTGPVSDTFLFPKDHGGNPDFFQVLKVKARSGDSGGPVTDGNGALIGILYGAGEPTGDDAYTHGTTIDRIQKVFGSKMKPARTLPINGNDYILRDVHVRQLQTDSREPFRSPQYRMK